MKLRNVWWLLLFFCSLVSADQWQLKKDSDGIQVYVRHVKGSAFRAFLGKVDIDASLNTLMAIHADGESVKEWLKDCEKSKFISTFSKDGYLMYFRTDAPWPVQDRDYVLRYQISQDPQTYTLTLSFNGEANLMPEQKDCVRVSEIAGAWRMTPLNAQRTHVEYEVHADPNGELPAWLANQFVVDQPFHTLKKLRQRARMTQYQNQHFDFVKMPTDSPGSETP